MDVYIKKIEKGDNWLLAKKPLNGSYCGSCENYLGDLNEKNNYLPWNKYPGQENRVYRVGSGFSKMLQMLNLEGGNNHSNLESLNNSRYNNKKDNNKGRVHSNLQKSFHNDNSVDSMEGNNKGKDDSNEAFDPLKPRVVKIFKMKKNNEK